MSVHMWNDEGYGYDDDGYDDYDDDGGDDYDGALEYKGSSYFFTEIGLFQSWYSNSVRSNLEE